MVACEDIISRSAEGFFRSSAEGFFCSDNELKTVFFLNYFLQSVRSPRSGELFE